MGCPCCGVHDCDNTLESIWDRFCTEHHHHNHECAITSCLQPVEKGFKTCIDLEHRKLELHYYERGKAMFQLKARLEHLRITQPHDSLSLGAITQIRDHLSTSDELSVTAADLHPDIEENEDKDDHTGAEESGDVNDHVLVDSNGELCDGKTETGNRALHARFGRRHSHNEELCVVSCGTILGREKFYGSEAPNGVRVSVINILHLRSLIDYLRPS
jgi:hypothetical protein